MVYWAIIVGDKIVIISSKYMKKRITVKSITIEIIL